MENSGFSNGPSPSSPVDDPEARVSLGQLIASGDEDAISGFRDAHVGQVRDYCTIACGPERADDACEAAFVDFLGRLLSVSGAEGNLEDMLLKATRSAAAPRFRLPERAPTARPELCAAVPELLAAHSNGELPAHDHVLSAHLKHCPRCQATVALTQRADAAFRAATGWATDAAADAEPAEPSASEAAPEPAARADAAHEPEERSDAAPSDRPADAVAEPRASTQPGSTITRRRRGGLVRKLTDATRSARRPPPSGSA